MYYIVNRFGIVHTIPANLLSTAQAQGSRLATADEIMAYEGGFVSVGVETPDAPRDDLTRIKGVGPRTAEALNAFGIFTFTDLIVADPVDVAAAMDGSSMKQVRAWQAHAEKLSRGQDA